MLAAAALGLAALLAAVVRGAPVVYVHVPKAGGAAVTAVLRRAARVERLRQGELRELPVAWARSPGSALRAAASEGGLTVCQVDWGLVLLANATGAVFLRDAAARSKAELGQLRRRQRDPRLARCLERNGMTAVASVPSCNTTALDACCRFLVSPHKCNLGGFCALLLNHQTAVVGATRDGGMTGTRSAAPSGETLALALANLRRAHTVGTVEAFDLSVCLLLWRLGMRRSFDAQCRGRVVDFPDVNEHHYGSLAGLDGGVVEALRAANALDEALYHEGVALFHEQVERMRDETGITLRARRR